MSIRADLGLSSAAGATGGILECVDLVGFGLCVVSRKSGFGRVEVLILTTTGVLGFTSPSDMAVSVSDARVRADEVVEGCDRQEGEIKSQSGREWAGRVVFYNLGRAEQSGRRGI